jgi:hypothetical protein
LQLRGHHLEWYDILEKIIYDRGTMRISGLASDSFDGLKTMRLWLASDLGYSWIPHFHTQTKMNIFSGQTWQQVWRFTINDSRDLTCHFSWPKMGIAMVCLFILVSWVCLNKKWIAGYPRSWQGNNRPDHETYIGWNLEWVSTCDRYINGYDMVRLKHWLPMGPISPCLWTWLGWTLKLWPWPWAIQRLTYGLPDVDWQSASVHQ